MDADFLKSFDLNIGDGIDRGEKSPGLNALLPVLYANNYDGTEKKYHHFGNAVFRRENGNWLADFGANEEGFMEFVAAMKLFKLHDHKFWQDAFSSAHAVWLRDDLKKAAREKVFFCIDSISRRVVFFENPAVALLFDTLEKTARYLSGEDIKIELVEDDV